MSSHHRSLANGAGSAEAPSESAEDITSPIIPSDPEFDSNDEQQPPTRSPTPTPPYESRPSRGSYMVAPPAAYDTGASGHLHQNGHSEPRQLHVPEALRRHNSSFVPFSEIPTLPAFLNNCNLSQYLQSFNEAGAADDAMPLILDFDDDELKSIMDAIPMKPFHAATFRMGVRDLRERSRMGSMHFDNSQSSFMHAEPHSKLHYSHSQFFQQPSQPQLPPQLSSQPPSQQSQNSHPSQNAPNSQPTRRYSQSHLQNGQPSNLHRQPSSRIGGHWSSSQGNSSSGQPGGPTLPTPSQVLSGGAIYQHAGGVARVPSGYYHPQPVPLFSQEHPPVQRTLSNSQNEHKHGIKRRRSTESPPTAVGDPSSSPVLPEPSSYNSNSSSSWSSTPKAVGGAHLDPATREMILHQALVYGKHSSRQLTKYEHAINCAAQTLALEDPTLLSHKGNLWNKAKAKLLEEDYDYKRGRSRSKLPEMTPKKETKISKEQLIMKREANASNAASIRIRRIASLNEHYNQKNKERDHILDLLLKIESNENKAARPKTWEAEAAEARENLNRVEVERANLSKELGSLKNKERKHQWYEKRKKGRTGEDRSQEEKNTDADEEAEVGTDTTVDPEGENSQTKALPQTAPSSKSTPATTVAPATNGTTTPNGAAKQEPKQEPAPKPLTWMPHIPVVADDTHSKASSSRSKKHKDVFRTSEYTATTKS
ncbi:hypothetical protein EMPS_08940 [Entomortierella parvispora]|uniref:Uncharacterized protein n=1 Tax=Entomortierella parvispora TaxID=205924 RepID=A0A9P3HH88_9FUNG|nr:hypothetical protein EMPS_08940 [Entomortierella parvispora]